MRAYLLGRPQPRSCIWQRERAETVLVPDGNNKGRPNPPRNANHALWRQRPAPDFSTGQPTKFGPSPIRGRRSCAARGGLGHSFSSEDFTRGPVGGDWAQIVVSEADRTVGIPEFRVAGRVAPHDAVFAVPGEVTGPGDLPARADDAKVLIGETSRAGRTPQFRVAIGVAPQN